MIIYQFKMIYNGEIKVSKAEYKLSEHLYYHKTIYRKVKVIEKGVSRPCFPPILFELGECDYDTYYSDKYEDVYKFIKSRKEFFNDSIKALEYRKQKYLGMLNNLDNSLNQIKGDKDE